MQVAIDTRTVDANDLLHVAGGRIACSLAQRAMVILKFQLQGLLTVRIRQWYGVRLFHARARLDLPTYEGTDVQRQLDAVSPASESAGAGRTIAFETLETAATLVRSATQFVAQGVALVQVLGGHRDGVLLCVVTGLSNGTLWFSQLNAFQPTRGASVRVSRSGCRC